MRTLDASKSYVYDLNDITLCSMMHTTAFHQVCSTILLMRSCSIKKMTPEAIKAFVECIASSWNIMRNKKQIKTLCSLSNFKPLLEWKRTAGSWNCQLTYTQPTKTITKHAILLDVKIEMQSLDTKILTSCIGLFQSSSLWACDCSAVNGHTSVWCFWISWICCLEYRLTTTLWSPKATNSIQKVEGYSQHLPVML